MKKLIRLFSVAFIACLFLGSMTPVSAQNILFETGFPADYVVDADIPGEGWVGVRTFGVSATSFKDLPNNGVFEGDGALKFLGYKEETGEFPSLTTPAYKSFGTINFYCYFQDNKEPFEYPIAGEVIIEKVVGGVTTEIGTITDAEVSADATEWTLLSFEVNETDSAQIIIRSITEDPDLRVWFDDMWIEENDNTAINEAALAVNISAYPNPTSNKLIVNLAGNKASQISMINVAGQLVETIDNPAQVSTIDVSNYNRGLYFVKINAEAGVTTKRITVK